MYIVVVSRLVVATLHRVMRSPQCRVAATLLQTTVASLAQRHRHDRACVAAAESAGQVLRDCCDNRLSSLRTDVRHFPCLISMAAAPSGKPGETVAALSAFDTSGVLRRNDVSSAGVVGACRLPVAASPPALERGPSCASTAGVSGRACVIHMITHFNEQ